MEYLMNIKQIQSIFRLMKKYLKNLPSSLEEYPFECKSGDSS